MAVASAMKKEGTKHMYHLPVRGTVEPIALPYKTQTIAVKLCQLTVHSVAKHILSLHFCADGSVAGHNRGGSRREAAPHKDTRQDQEPRFQTLTWCRFRAEHAAVRLQTTWSAPLSAPEQVFLT